MANKLTNLNTIFLHNLHRNSTHLAIITRKTTEKKIKHLKKWAKVEKSHHSLHHKIDTNARRRKKEKETYVLFYQLLQNTRKLVFKSGADLGFFRGGGGGGFLKRFRFFCRPFCRFQKFFKKQAKKRLF